ncbi:hypothetical protein ABZ671_18510 [Micromonospora sp. NPDC006766]|uniref:hypothetical protein n=1 Tax=Micromonospora sp. NPDC006766 TaxID=3154778 RepID=UPI0033C3CA94
MTDQPQVGDSARARLVMSEALQMTAEFATSLVPTYADHHMEFGEHLQAARRLRLCAERVIDATIAVEAAAGATVEEIAVWLALPVETIEMRLAAQRAKAAAVDPPTLAGRLDAWYARVGGPDAPSNAVSAGLV